MSILLAAEEKASTLSGILPLLILAPIAYVLIVPQRKQRKKQAEMQASLAVGDEVVTSGGIHGTITYLEDNVAHVSVDTDVVIRVSKSSVTKQPSAAEPADAPAAADADADTDEPPSKASKAPKNAKS